MTTDLNVQSASQHKRRTSPSNHPQTSGPSSPTTTASMDITTTGSEINSTSQFIPDVMAAAGLDNYALPLPVLSQSTPSRNLPRIPPDLESGVPAHQPPRAEERRHWETRIKVTFGIAIISLQLLHLGVLYAFRNTSGLQLQISS